MNKKDYCFRIAFLTALFFNLSFAAQAQNADSECKKKLVALDELAKAESYGDLAYKPWLELKNKCPKFDESVYLIGEKILSQKIEQANASDAKNEMIAELARLYDEHDKNFPNNGRGSQISKALLLYLNKNGTEDEIYSFLNTAFKTQYQQFNSPIALNVYSELIAGQMQSGAGKMTAEQALEKLDLVSEKVQAESAVAEKSSENLALKSQSATLTADEKRILSDLKARLEELKLVAENVNGRIGLIAGCKEIESYYQKDFDKNKENALWLERAASRMGSKKCVSEFYVKLASQLHAVSPSSKSAKAMAAISRTARNSKQSAAYYEEAAALETDSKKKAEIYYSLATTYGYTNKPKAREAALKALAIEPSMGKAYTFISQLYANSANDCGADEFEKKAVYWLAAANAKKAGIVQPKLKQSADALEAEFLKMAPSKQEVASARKKTGQQIAIACWINESVSIPKM
ncbi:MAG TPA: hypothetical protein VFR70_04395 [Flavobacterium sp.]|nr:hypothetical protein [Flavobacterium sp.]